MNSLGAAPLAGVLQELLAAAARERGPGGARQRSDRPRPEHRADDYRAEYAGADNRFMAVPAETGQLLYTFVRSTRARSVVEFGTSFGVSTLFLAAGLRDNGGGRLIGTEYEPGKVATVRATMAEAGVADLVEVREGDAMATLADDLPSEVDLVLLDGAKGMYLDVFRLLEPRLRSGAVVLADNASRAEVYLQHVRDDPAYLCTAIGELDLEISCRTG